MSTAAPAHPQYCHCPVPTRITFPAHRVSSLVNDRIRLYDTNDKELGHFHTFRAGFNGEERHVLETMAIWIRSSMNRRSGS